MYPARTLAVALLSLLLFPTLSAAAPMTITFDLGAYDPTITDPTGDFHGPYDWIEDGGVRVAGFWAQGVGTANGKHVLGHTHLVDNVTMPAEMAPHGYRAEAMHSYAGDMQGLVITLENGGTFDLISADYDVFFREFEGDPELARLPWSYGVNDPHILIAESFDPTLPDFESQWTAFAATSTFNFPENDRDWRTLDFSGPATTNLTSLMITQTAGQTWLDNIVIDIHTSTTVVPEPGTALLLGLGLAALARRPRR